VYDKTKPRLHIMNFPVKRRRQPFKPRKIFHVYTVGDQILVQCLGLLTRARIVNSIGSRESW
jgi:hypothetical protein